MSNNNFIKAGDRGAALSLTGGIKAVNQGIALFSTKRAEIALLVNQLAVASVQVMLDHNKDDSAIVKLAEALMTAGCGRGSDYATYLRFLEKCGLVVDFDATVAEGEIATMKVDKKGFNKMTATDEARKKLNELLYDTLVKADCDIHTTLQAKPKRKPRGKAKAEDDATKPSEAVDAQPVDVALDKVRDTLALVAGDNPNKCKQIVALLERLTEVTVVMEQPANVLQMLENQGIFDKLSKQATATGMVDKLKAMKAGNSAKV